MTRRLRRRLEQLENNTGDEGAGFHHFQIGGDPDPAAGGYYTWSETRGAYVNDADHTIPPEEAPESEFEYTIEYADESSEESP